MFTTEPTTTALGSLTPVVRHADEGDAAWFLNCLVTTKASASETGGAYCIMEHLLTAASNPPRHVQDDEEEAFYVLEGEVEFEVDGTVATCRAGSFALVPRGAPHAFRVLSDTARMLVIASAGGQAHVAGGGLEHFFTEAAGEPA
ncbi:MAG TPA: cupin domain-containing protein, partial [Aquihabitans sp.]|nr:cupin domain-containing protein [Aquihabitans sp.]